MKNLIRKVMCFFGKHEWKYYSIFDMQQDFRTCKHCHIVEKAMYTRIWKKYDTKNIGKEK